MNREEEITAVKAVIAHPAGFDVSVFGDRIMIRTTGGPMNDEETVEVEWKIPFVKGSKGHGSKSFPRVQLDEAVAFFVDKRHELQLGIDYEGDDA